MWDIAFILILTKMLLEEVNLAFIIVHHESDDVVEVDHSLNLTFFVGSEDDKVQVVLVDHLHRIWNFGVYIEIYQLGFFIVVVLF